ncbi:S53 family peptidase [Allobranchiibius huperziae]|uniref:Subtilase family serine protease n=1 Tax=Allobranchiibius huperziae TaxID=1874116 RepID=A0A853DHE0_9MICO|nr:S53 family peptidase [Allobranchiibius huperziae]NYJ76107.1 subtilase family serine protease [Allobranchiibius huperziae]
MRKSPVIAALALASASALTGALTPSASAAGSGVQQAHSCTQKVAKGYATCFAVKLENTKGAAVNAAGRSITPRAISGKTPTDIRSAYKLAGLNSGGRTVAIVDAYGYPNAERDLGVYRSQFGLSSCTKANGCLTIENQSGSTTSLPSTDVGWDQEQALDLDAVSAACPDCKILLVQASSASNANLGTAVNTAAKKSGVVAISNSYGGGDSSDSTYGKYYNHPGIAVTASTGDDGYQGASYPASSHYVTAVGGTSLYTASNTRGWTESAWSGAGSGCTTLNTAPSGQNSAVTHCSGRAMADVSAVADPNTGLAVYAPTSSTSSSWAQYGGTSLSSPIVASVYALSGNTAGYANTLPYAHTSGLFDVTSGSNGSCSYYCSAQSGWDGPTGLGTPNGTSAF